MAQVVKESACSSGDIGEAGSVLGLGRSHADGNGNPLQYSCLENPMDRGARRSTVHGVGKSQLVLAVEHAHIPEGRRCLN